MISALIFFIVYIAIGSLLVHGTLYISKYDLEKDGLDRWRIIAVVTVIWPIFFLLIAGYWMWVSYHNFKHYWARSL